MLVLSRQRDETIMIGDEIEITVVDVRGDKVRLGINAPSRIAVHRKEVYEAIRRENAEAAKLQAPELSALAQTLRAGPSRSKGSGLAVPGPVGRPGSGGSGAGGRGGLGSGLGSGGLEARRTSA